ncbi:hypothetical protein [Streptomyces hypolithicus]
MSSAFDRGQGAAGGPCAEEYPADQRVAATQTQSAPDGDRDGSEYVAQGGRRPGRLGQSGQDVRHEGDFDRCAQQ